MREGIFSEEDMGHLENGYSVSETDEEHTHLDGDILSLRSGMSGIQLHLRGSPSRAVDHGDLGHADSNHPKLISQQRHGFNNLNSEAVLMRQGELENQIRNQE